MRPSTLFSLVLFAACGALSSPIPAPIPVLEDSAITSSDLEERTNYYGDGTYFSTGLGACGWTNKDSDHIVAISKDIYGSGNMGKHCGGQVSITYKGKTHTAKIVDKCMGCKPRDLDMSESLFKLFAPLSVGRMQVEWHYI